MSWTLEDKALFTKGLDVTEKLVLVALAYHANKDTSLCWPSQATLAKICERSEKRVNQLLDSLCDKHLIAQVGRHGATIEYKIFPSAEEAEKAESERRLRKAKYHAAAAERGRKIKEKNEQKRKAEAAAEDKATPPNHPADGMSDYPADGIQTDNTNREENLLSNQEDKKENNPSEVIRQDSNKDILYKEPTQGRSGQVLSGDRQLTDFVFDNDSMRTIITDVIKSLKGAGMTETEIDIRFKGVAADFSSWTEEWASHGYTDTAGKAIKKGNHLKFARICLMNKMNEYTGSDLDGDTMRTLLHEHCLKKYPQHVPIVEKIFHGDPLDSDLCYVQCASEIGWLDESGTPYNNPIQWGKKVMENCIVKEITYHGCTAD